MSEVVLYDYWRSSASYRVRIALNLARIPYQAVSIDLVTKQNKTKNHLDRNPQGLVPVLNIDGSSFTQSLAIIEYLDTTRNLGLLPDTPAERAQCQALAQSIAVDLHPICNLSVTTYAVELTNSQETRDHWMTRFIEPGLASFELLLAQFEQIPFSTGDHISLADLCLIPQIYNAHRWQADYSRCKRIKRVFAACSNLPEFAAAHPDRVKPS